MIDLKYRPKKFSEVIGNSGVVKVLLTRSRLGSLHGRSIMFGGPKGCGKTSLARIVARAASCQNLQDGEPCNECITCQNFLNETSTGFEEFDAASHGSVDKIRSLVDELDYGNVDGLNPILILDEAHRLGPAAQDSMLKAMEERRMTVILCTTEPWKIRAAVRDRVEEYSVRPLNESEAIPWMEKICKSESITYEKEALIEIAKNCDFSPRSCLNSISSISLMGDVTIQSVRELYRYNSIETLANVLKDFDSNSQKALVQLDSILGIESPTWIRDHIIKLISLAIRKSLKVPTRFNYPVHFFESRSVNGWNNLARFLAGLDKPSAYDIELALISTKESVNVQDSIPRNVVQNTDKPQDTDSNMVGEIQERLVVSKSKVDVVKSPTGVAKTIEIDGVMFSSDERLTSLDDKIEPSRGPEVINKNESSVQVEFDKSKIPLSEQEFSRAFLERFKK